MRLLCLLFISAILFSANPLNAQRKKKDTEPAKKEEKKKDPLKSLSLSGLKWRGVGPAITSGRISDLAVNPNNPFEYYAAIASGGVWKTINAGVTFTPIFDAQSSYSIGCITMDPNNSNVIWVGSGENNNQRSVAYGDGVYKSSDGGKSWKNMGLKNSEHIGKIIVHPENSDIIYVAAIGPLWSSGGDRGLYKSMDGGTTWDTVLYVDKHTGVNDVIMDPRNPEILYASTLQRRRHVYTYVGGGPGSGLHKSTDGGANWTKIQKGLPTVELGRIGLAISPADPEYLYAIVEAADRKGGFYRSTNRGASWEKRSSHSTSGNYYQEIIPDPINPDRIYSMDTWMKVSHDGGKTFKNVGEDTKHVDNHCMWINPQNTDHWLVGCDGGIYETFDAAKTWDFKENLPVTQFYKVALDNAEPFYNIYGGTQDNFSMGGPSRVVTAHGITNQDWFMTHGGDGFESQVDPNNPNIVYAQSQYGVLVRFDRLNGEEVGIQPKPSKDENAFRWNWDAPLIASPHADGRVYFAANKVFRSDDYGNSWTTISDDLSRQLDRNTLKVYDRIVSMDAVMKNGSTSPYGTIVAMAESSINENLIAIGTDDGLIQITEDGGSNWRKIDNIPGAPEQSYVNNIYLSQHDENVVYVAFNHHKYGDFKPYVFKSIDKGANWQSISNNLPERGSVYALEEDFIDPNLLFCGTEFSFYFSADGGEKWKKLSAGLPTIAVRDIAIQKRENDLVLGTFGRGFYVLDDYSPLRSVSSILRDSSAQLFASRDALMWEQSTPLGLPGKAFQGDNYYSASNLGPEAIIRYFYPSKFESIKDQRKKAEKKARKDKKDNPYPSYESLKHEQEEKAPSLVITIEDDAGKVVKKFHKKPAKGLQSIHWNLRYNSQNPINLNKSSFYNPFAGNDNGTLVNPGSYKVHMQLLDGDSLVSLSASTLNVLPLNNATMPAEDREAKVNFQREVAALSGELSACGRMMSEMRNKIKHIHAAIDKSETPMYALRTDVKNVERQLDDISTELYGDRLKSRLDIGQPMAPGSRIGWITYEQKYSTSAPTKTHLESFAIANAQFQPIKQKVETIFTTDIKRIESELERVGAPYTPGRVINE